MEQSKHQHFVQATAVMPGAVSRQVTQGEEVAKGCPKTSRHAVWQNQANTTMA